MEMVWGWWNVLAVCRRIRYLPCSRVQFSKGSRVWGGRGEGHMHNAQLHPAELAAVLTAQRRTGGNERGLALRPSRQPLEQSCGFQKI